jgi:hypothetical protein
VKPATTEELHAVFNTFDTDGGGDVSVVELERMLQRLGVTSTPDSVAAMLTKYDVDGNGVLDFEEFTSFVESSRKSLVSSIVVKRLADDKGGVGGGERAPAHKWFYLGSKGSGRTVRHDPPHLSSWSACVVGARRWALIDPLIHTHLDDAAIRGSSFERNGPGEGPRLDPESWFRDVLPWLRSEYQPYVRELLQPAGTIVYLPPNTIYSVLNLEDSNGVTENYIAQRDFDASLARARDEVLGGRSKFFVHRRRPLVGSREWTADALSVASSVDREFGFGNVERTQKWIDAVEARENDDGRGEVEEERTGSGTLGRGRGCELTALEIKLSFGGGPSSANYNGR